MKWHWHDADGGKYLRCDLLDRWPHAFVDRQWSSQGPLAITRVLAADAVPHRVSQVHGCHIVKAVRNTVVEESESGQGDDAASRPEADGLVSGRPGQALWVCTADCVPILVADQAGQRVAAIHAGWRGIQAGIVEQAIDVFLDGGTRPKDLVVAMGPAISGTRYQVSREVAAGVMGHVLEGTTSPPQPTARRFKDWMRNHADVLTADPEEGKARLDLRKAIVLQLRRLGVPADAVAVAPFCTYSQPTLFHSYRREGRGSVQWSGIVSRPY